MKKNVYLLIFLFVLTFWSVPMDAQDPDFSQFYNNPIYTNPAFTGSEFNRISLASRVQYYGLPGGFVTQNIAYDQHIKKIKGGLGFMYTHDVAGEGVLTANHVYASYSFEKEVMDKFCFRFGIQAGILQKSLQWNQLRWGDNIIAQLGFLTPTNTTLVDRSITLANFNAGALVYSRKFYAGIAVHNLTQPNQSFFGESGPGTILPCRYTVHGGALFTINPQNTTSATLSPNFLLLFQDAFNQLNLGVTLHKAHFSIGSYFRQTTPNSDAIISMVGFQKGRFKVGYSLDIIISQLRSAGKAAHEFAIIYHVGTKGQKRLIPSPTFGF